ncbi:WW domain-binding protein 11-like [Macrosteles quadrilineatus]|uniref:WW domain-binding protein 11-like n=1 Tax=Macrosteles quadrilineatus TaxID=74068 RepID=UPI0023E1BA26|nr:WW domain-binding protein 11-like [Macrosteles quadrilineatus]
MMLQVVTYTTVKLVIYLQLMSNLPQRMDPQEYRTLANSYCTVRRTNKFCSRIWTDMVKEQTANWYVPTPVYNGTFSPLGPPPAIPATPPYPPPSMLNYLPQPAFNPILMHPQGTCRLQYTMAVFPPGTSPAIPATPPYPPPGNAQLLASASLQSHFDATSGYVPTPLYNGMFSPLGPPPAIPATPPYPPPSMLNYLPQPAFNPIAMHPPGLVVSIVPGAGSVVVLIGSKYGSYCV